MSKKTPLTIEVYTEEGLMHESIGGPMDFEDVRATMISILKNDGIPVIRAHGKHAAKGDAQGKHAAKPEKTEPTMPLSVTIVCDNLRFSATGLYEDVMDAQAEFLKAIMEEE